MANKMAEKALQQSRSFGIRRIPALRPLGWLARGWRDLWRCPVPGLLHGLVLALFGIGIVLVAGQRFWLLAGSFSGFLAGGARAGHGALCREPGPGTR